MDYQREALAGKNPVELIVALYDGMLRFLSEAIAAVERGDVSARRIAVKHVFDILMHLQSRLRMDVGGSSAQSLAEFYAATFALCLEGSRLASVARLEEAMACIRDVREAWSVAARDPEVLALLEREGQAPVMSGATPEAQVSSGASWSA
jgi:flagellar secretion chaperone FliS